MLGFSIKDKWIAGLAPKNNKLYCLFVRRRNAFYFLENRLKDWMSS
jgi:hypothetical protein